MRLHCSVTNVEDSGVSWIRLSDYQILTNGLTTFTTDRRFKLLHTPGGAEWTLELLSVMEKDEGGYQCQVSSEVITHTWSQHVSEREANGVTSVTHLVKPLGNRDSE